MLRARSTGSAGAHLEWRVRLVGVGIILALVGIYFESRWAVWAALAVLASALVLARLPSPGSDPAAGKGREDDGRDA